MSVRQPCAAIVVQVQVKSVIGLMGLTAGHGAQVWRSGDAQHAARKLVEYAIRFLLSLAASRVPFAHCLVDTRC